jgi:hypothetical protein
MNKDNENKKKQRLFYIIGIIILIILLLFGLSMCGRDNPGTNDDPLVFEDPIFKQAIATLEKGSNDEIYPKDLNEISTVQILADKVLMYKKGEEQARLVWMFGEYVEIDDVKFEGVGTMSSLADLKHFPALESLTVAFQKNIDYSTIDNIQNVNYMYLYANELSTLDFVKKSNKLYALNVNHHKLDKLRCTKYITKLDISNCAFGD